MPFMTETTFNALPPWIAERYKSIIDRAQALRNEPYAPYGEERLANIPQDIVNAHRMGRQTGITLPYLEASRDMLNRNQGEFPQEYERYMNPYQQAVINRIAEEGNRNLQERILPALEAKFVGLGQHGSSRHARLAREAARDIQNEISANQAKALATGYQQAAQIFNADKTRGLEAANQMSGLGALRQGAQLADITMLTDQGRYQQQQEQAEKDINYQDFLRKQAYPWEQLAQQTGIMHGTPVPTQSSHFTQTPGTPQLNVLGQLGALATGFTGARLASGKKRGGHIKNVNPYLMHKAISSKLRKRK